MSKKQKTAADSLLKRRTRSDKNLDEKGFSELYGNQNSPHVPVLVGEVVDVFSSLPLNSFVDCTLGAGCHSAQVNSAINSLSFYSLALPSYCYDTRNRWH